MYFSEILEQYRKLSFSERDKGSRFERLMQAYLLTDPKYSNQIQTAWLWNEFPYRRQFGKGDSGIDLVALTCDGEYWAVQCKCFQDSESISKPSVDSFLSTSSREFKNDNGQTKQFSLRFWISTTNKWGSNATQAITNQNPPVTRINLVDLQEAPVDWEKLNQGIHGEDARFEIKTLYKHQRKAVDKTKEYFKSNDRGKLIMACGTGKTFTSLRIAENETDGKGLVLFLVPSIALLGQTLRAWCAEAREPINAICICSDPEVSKKKTKRTDIDAFSVIDLAFPASTNPENILDQFNRIQKKTDNGMTVVFSTYQSIDVIAKAQEVLLAKGFPEFDFIICDEAHRTTGVSLKDEDESAFTKVHDGSFLKAKKRLYMTATPRLYSDDAKSKAAEAEAMLCSMDDPKMYGTEIYRIGFGEAVEHNLLTDYKVLILTLSDKDVPLSLQNSLAGQESQIHTDDVTKLVGCINALSKKLVGDDGAIVATDPGLMKRAVAFCPSIIKSEQITNVLNTVSEEYHQTLSDKQKECLVSVSSQHIDGTMSAPRRDEMLGWLKEPASNNECRVLTNVRVLSEGVDVPSLDAVMFLSAKNSQVDVVQSVGRVMRKAPGKKYGYIIIPVVIPSDIEPSKALDDNKRFKVVWTVLNALRAHDDRFNATINKIELNKKKPDPISVVGIGDPTEEPEQEPSEKTQEKKKQIARQLSIQFQELQSVVFAKMVKKVGDRRYWEQWAKDVAVIAERQIERIQYLVSERKDQRKAFDLFLDGLHKNINPSIDQEQAIEMLAQHIITKPIFDALFEGYSFQKNNAVSIAMQKMLDALEDKTFEKESEKLQKFYDSVRKRAEGIDNAQGKQKIIIELYDKFFKTAFPKMVEKLGIVYTPVEIVDFILHSVNDVLKQEFGRSLSDENIHILDPFTGTGTFITRLIQTGLIKSEDLARKYRHELYANEIVLLAYYIAAVNIENAFHDQMGDQSGYESFEGIALTDTFQLGESDGSDQIFSEMFPHNSERVERQKKAPLRVIIGNPPYSVGQKSANDNAQNLKYERLDARIADTYARATNATNKNSLYDSYIKAFRWSTDRLDPEHGGMIGYVSNGAWLDGNSADGFRKILEQEFSSIWVFNLRGNQRTSGELSRREGGKIFGSGSRTPIAVTLLVKNPNSKQKKAEIHYHDIGDYLSREEKLTIARKFGSFNNPKMIWKTLKPNEHGDWINQRNDEFASFIPLGEKKSENEESFFYPMYSRGLATARDAWCYNSRKTKICESLQKLVEFYNKQRNEYHRKLRDNPSLPIEEFLDFHSRFITWNRGLKGDLLRDKAIRFEGKKIHLGLYRPFFKQHVYLAQELNDMVYQIPKLFPDQSKVNSIICIPAPGGKKDPSTLMTNCVPDLHLIGDSQCFPLYYYEKPDETQPGLFGSAKDENIRRDGITDFIHNRCKKQYGNNVGKEDIFYYVYGILHSPDYRAAFAVDLKKSLPRIPLVDDVREFWAFSKAGRKLADLHINYESVPPYPGVTVTGENSEDFTVTKMRFPKIDGEVRGKKKKVNDFSIIVYNSYITISDIPEKAYEYIVNGKSAIEWIMDRYQVRVDKKSGIKNDPNDWAKEVGNPRYILDLLLSVINVSVQTVDIVEKLPKLSFEG